MNKLICPFCKADLHEFLMYVEEGCTNYIYYSFKDGKWSVSDELDGDGDPETYWACKKCSEELPDDMQKYFTETNNIL